MEVTMEAPSFVNTFCVWVMMVIFVVGKIRDLFWRPPALRKGYAPITNARDSFYQRRLYSRVVDCWNRPIASPPGAWIDVMRRTDLSGRALSTKLELEGAPHHACLNLGSYNYLGFAAHDPYCTPRALAALERWGVSQCSSRAEGGGTTPLHAELETLIAAHVGAEAALTYGMGFATNSASIPALLLAEGQQGHGWPLPESGGDGGKSDGPASAAPPAINPPGRGCLVLSDELNHSSIVAGVKASGARVRVFRHNDTAHLERLLRESISRGQPRTRRPWKKVLVLVEGVYSMEGETCPLAEIVALKKRYKAYLYLDEAHSIGALGKTGRGLCEQAGVDPRDVDCLMGTFTKAFGSCGGYVAGSRELIEHLRKVGPAHLFATAMAPAAVAQVIAALRLMRGEDDEGGWRRCCRRRVAAAAAREREAAEVARAAAAAKEQAATTPRGGAAEGAGAALKRLLLSPLSPRRPPTASALWGSAAAASAAADATAGDATAGNASSPAHQQQQSTGDIADAATTTTTPSRAAAPAPVPPMMEPVSGGRGLAKVAALRANANYFRARLLAMGLHVLGDWDSPIMPVMIYHNAFLSLVSRQCLERRLAVVVVGFPATPLFEGRARVCISAAHTRADLDYALDVIDDVTRRLGLQFGRGSEAAKAAAARVEELERELQLRRRAVGDGASAAAAAAAVVSSSSSAAKVAAVASSGDQAAKAKSSSKARRRLAAAGADAGGKDAAPCGGKQRERDQRQQQGVGGVGGVGAAAAVVVSAVGEGAGKRRRSLGGDDADDDDADDDDLVLAATTREEEEGGSDEEEEEDDADASSSSSSDGGDDDEPPCRFCCAGDEGHFHAAAEAARARHAEQDRLAEAALQRQLLMAGGGAGGAAAAAGGAAGSAAAGGASKASAAYARGAASANGSAANGHHAHAHADGGDADGDGGFVAQRVGCGPDWGVDPGALALTRFLRARALAAGRLAGGAGPSGGGGLLAMMRSAWTR